MSFSVVALIATDDSDSMPYQSFCHPSEHNGECSNNINCRCSTVMPTGERVCILKTNCSNTAACNANDICDDSQTICVTDSRCNKPLCYPIASTSPDICPPLATSDNVNSE